MRYARGGERHAALRLILGAADDPAVEQALSALCDSSERSGGTIGTGRSSTGGGSEHRTETPLMRAEGGAEYWHYFGFLAASDFDCAHETLKYVDEQLRRQRELSSSPQCRPTSAVSMLVGAGWDEQNGTFTAEAPLPQATERAPPSPSSAPVSSVAMMNAVPLRLTLRYESRGTYELTGFLADGVGDETIGQGRVPMLYGVWATAPSQHKHLFALRLVASLPTAE